MQAFDVRGIKNLEMSVARWKVMAKEEEEGMSSWQVKESIFLYTCLSKLPSLCWTKAALVHFNNLLQYQETHKRW